MYMVLQTAVVAGVFVVLLFVNLALTKGPQGPERPEAPLVLKAMPLFAITNGTLFAIEVWASRPYNGFVARSLWSGVSFLVACFAFVWAAATVTGLVTAFAQRK